MDFVIFFIIGAFIGSFFNVVIYRLPRDESVIKPRSHCPNCKKPIPFYRNVPIISFIIQLGRCANCKQRISIQYPTVELINGLLWGWAFKNLLFPEAIAVSLLFSILIAIAWIDYRIYMIPLDLIIVGAIIISFSIIFGVLSLHQALLGIVAGVFFPGAWLGPILMILTLFFASLLGLIVWILISMFQGMDRNRPLPFAPYLAFSAISIFILSNYSTTLIDRLIMV